MHLFCDPFIYSYDGNYPTGFHVFLNEKDAKYWLACYSNKTLYPNQGYDYTCIKQVMYKQGHTEGKQSCGDYTLDVIVAKEIYIF